MRARGGRVARLADRESVLGVVGPGSSEDESDGNAVSIGTALTCGNRSARPMLAFWTDAALRCVLKLAAVRRERCLEKPGCSA